MPVKGPTLAHFIAPTANVVTRFGAPTTPIIVRKSHTYEEGTTTPETEVKLELDPENEHAQE